MKHRSQIDWMITITLPLIALAYGAHYLWGAAGAGAAGGGLALYLTEFSAAAVELVHRMWWGVAIGIVAVGVMSRLPQKIVLALISGRTALGGILRATLGGVLLDLCSHGILLVGMQLYKRGATLGQTMAFLIASPWNSLSFTLILFALVGVRWTIAMLLLSMLIAVISGLIFELLVARGVLPANPARAGIAAGGGGKVPADDSTATVSGESEGEGEGAPADPAPKRYSLRDLFRREYLRPASLGGFLKDSWSESRMVIRWIALGLLIAAVVRTAVPVESFQRLFGPTLAGVGLTLLVATILEVCSEGSAPLAADMLTRAAAPGNGFAFLMAGVATDYTEIAAIRQASGRWRVALFLPLVTLPQIVVVAVLMNQ